MSDNVTDDPMSDDFVGNQLEEVLDMLSGGEFDSYQSFSESGLGNNNFSSVGFVYYAYTHLAAVTKAFKADTGNVIRDPNFLVQTSTLLHTSASYISGLSGKLGNLGSEDNRVDLYSSVFSLIGSSSYNAALVVSLFDWINAKKIITWHEQVGDKLGLKYSLDFGDSTYLDRGVPTTRLNAFGPLEDSAKGALLKHKAVILGNIGEEIESILDPQGLGSTAREQHVLRVDNMLDSINMSANNEINDLAKLEEFNKKFAVVKDLVNETTKDFVSANFDKYLAPRIGTEMDSVQRNKVDKITTEFDGLNKKITDLIGTYNLQDTPDPSIALTNVKNYGSAVVDKLEKANSGRITELGNFYTKFDGDVPQSLKSSYHPGLRAFNIGDAGFMGSMMLGFTDKDFDEKSHLEKATASLDFLGQSLFWASDLLFANKGIIELGPIKNLSLGTATLGASTVFFMAGVMAKIADLSEKSKAPGLTADQIQAYNTEIALQSTAMTLSVTQGILDSAIMGGVVGSKYFAVASPILGSMAAIASAINPLQWASFDSQEGYIDHVKARDDYSAELLGANLSGGLTVQQDFATAKLSVDIVTNLASGLLAATGGFGAPLAFAVAAIGGITSGILSMVERRELEWLAKTTMDQITADGTRSVDDYFLNSFKQEFEATKVDMTPLMETLIKNAGYDSAVIIGSETFTISDVELIQKARATGLVTKSAANFGSSYSLEMDESGSLQGVWDDEVVTLKDISHDRSIVQFADTTGDSRYVATYAPLLEAHTDGYKTYEKIEDDKSSTNYYTKKKLANLDDFDGWVIQDDDTGTDTTFDITNIINYFRYDKRQEVDVDWVEVTPAGEATDSNPNPQDIEEAHTTKNVIFDSGPDSTAKDIFVDFHIKGFDGDDTFIDRGHWVNFEGGNGDDSAVFSLIEDGLLREGITIESYMDQSNNTYSGDSTNTVEGWLRVVKIALDKTKVLNEVLVRTFYDESDNPIARDKVLRDDGTYIINKGKIKFEKDVSTLQYFEREGDFPIYTDLKSVERIVATNLDDNIDLRGHSSGSGKNNNVIEVHGLGGNDVIIGDTTTRIVTGGVGDDFIDLSEHMKLLVAQISGLNVSHAGGSYMASSIIEEYLAKIGVSDLTYQDADDLQTEIYKITGLWADDKITLDLENGVHGPTEVLEKSVLEDFKAGLKGAALGEMVYIDGGTGFDVVSWDSALMNPLISAYIEANNIKVFAEGFAEKLGGAEKDSTLAEFLGSQIRSNEFLNPFGQTIFNNVERIAFDLEEKDSLTAYDSTSHPLHLLYSPQLNGEHGANSIVDRTWMVADYNNMIKEVLNTTGRHVEFSPQGSVHSYKIGAFIEHSSGFRTDELLRFDMDHLSDVTVYPENPLFHATITKEFKMNTDDSIFNLDPSISEVLVDSSSLLKGGIHKDSVVVHETEYHFEAGKTYSLRFDGDFAKLNQASGNSSFKAILVIGNTKFETLDLSDPNQGFTYMQDISDYQPVKLVVQRGGDGSSSGSVGYGVSIQRPGDKDFDTFGIEEEILAASDEIGYATQMTVATYSTDSGVNFSQGHQGGISGTLAAEQTVTFSGDIYLKAGSSYLFIEHAPGYSRLKIGDDIILSDSRQSNDQIGKPYTVEISGHYAYEFTATNTRKEAADFALGIGTSDIGKYIIMKGETGDTTASVSAANIAASTDSDRPSGVNILGDHRSEYQIGSNYDDFLSGAQGHDELDGGKGNDIYVGGPGIDTFIFGANASGHDLIVFSDPENLGHNYIYYQGGHADALKSGRTADGDLVITDGFSSITIANFYELSEPVWIVYDDELDGPTPITQIQTIIREVITATQNDESTVEVDDVSDLPMFGDLSAYAVESNNPMAQITPNSFNQAYHLAHQSQEFLQARESFLGAAVKIENGTIQDTYIKQFLHDVARIEGDISLNVAEDLGLLPDSLPLGVSQIIDDTDGEILLEFDGSGVGLELDLSDYLFANQTADGFSFTAFMKMGELSTGNQQYIFHIVGETGEDVRLFQKGTKNGLENDLVFEYTSSDGEITTLTAENVLEAGVTTHWAVTIKADGSLSIYKNAKLISSEPHPSSFAPFEVKDVVIGSQVDQSGTSLVGSLSNLWFRDNSIDISDVRASSAEAPVLINALPEVDDLSFTMNEDETLNVISSDGFLGGATDPDGHAVKISSIDGSLVEFPNGGPFVTSIISESGRTGEISVSANGAFTIDLKGNFLDLEYGQYDNFDLQFGISDIYGEKTMATTSVEIAGAGEYFGEWGTTTTGDQWVTVNFSKTYVDPVVVAFIGDYNEADFAKAQIKVADDGNSFDVRVQESSDFDGSHIDETINYIVFNAGTHILDDGTVIHAGKADVNRNGNWQALPIEGGIGAPVYFTSVTNNTNENEWVSDRIRYDGGSATRKTEIKLTHEAASGTKTGSEKVNYITFEGFSENTSFYNLKFVAYSSDLPASIRSFDVDFSEIRSEFDASSNWYYDSPAVVRFVDNPQSSNEIIVQQDGTTGSFTPNTGSGAIGIWNMNMAADSGRFWKTGTWRMEGSKSDDTLNGTDRGDELLGGEGADNLIGGIGNDLLDGGPGADIIDAGPGQDTIIYNGDEYFIDGGSDDDEIEARVGTEPVELRLTNSNGGTISVGDAVTTVTGIEQFLLSGNDDKLVWTVDAPVASVIDAKAGFDVAVLDVSGFGRDHDVVQFSIADANVVGDSGIDSVLIINVMFTNGLSEQKILGLNGFEKVKVLTGKAANHESPYIFGVGHYEVEYLRTGQPGIDKGGAPGIEEWLNESQLAARNTFFSFGLDNVSGFLMTIEGEDASVFDYDESTGDLLFGDDFLPSFDIDWKPDADLDLAYEATLVVSDLTGTFIESIPLTFGVYDNIDQVLYSDKVNDPYLMAGVLLQDERVHFKTDGKFYTLGGQDYVYGDGGSQTVEHNLIYSSTDYLPNSVLFNGGGGYDTFELVIASDGTEAIAISQLGNGQRLSITTAHGNHDITLEGVERLLIQGGWDEIDVSSDPNGINGLTIEYVDEFYGNGFSYGTVNANGTGVMDESINNSDTGGYLPVNFDYDYQGSGLSFHLAGEDAQLFEIRGNQIGKYSWNGTGNENPFDYESPQDADNDGVYTFTYIVKLDGVTQASYDLDFAIEDVNEAPVFSIPNHIYVPENTFGNGVILLATATDPEGDSITYSISGNGADLFSIDEQSGALTQRSPLDYEEDVTTTSVNIVATDDHGLSSSKNIVVEVTDVPEAPVFEHSSITLFTDEKTLVGGGADLLSKLFSPSATVMLDVTNPNARSLKVSTMKDIAQGGNGVNVATQATFIDQPALQPNATIGEHYVTWHKQLSDREGVFGQPALSFKAITPADGWGALWYNDENDNGRFDLSNDRGLVISDPNLDIGQATTARSWGLTFKTGGDIHTRQVIYDEGGGSNNFAIYLDDGKLYVSIMSMKEGWGAPVYITDNVTGGTDYALAVIYDGAAGTLEAVLNGTNIGSATTGSIFGLHNSPHGLGKVAHNTRLHDNVKVFDGSHPFEGKIGKFMLAEEAFSLEAARIATTVPNTGDDGAASLSALFGTNATVMFDASDSESMSGNKLLALTDIATGGRSWEDATPVSWVDGSGSLRYDEDHAPSFVHNGIFGEAALSFDGVDDGLAIDPTFLGNEDIYGTSSDRSWGLTFRTGVDIDTRQVIYDEGGNGTGFLIYLDAGKLYLSMRCGDWSSNEPAYLSIDVEVETDYALAAIMDAWDENMHNAWDDSWTGTLEAALNGTSMGKVTTGGYLKDHNSWHGIGKVAYTAKFHDNVTATDGMYAFQGLIGKVMIADHMKYLQGTTIADLEEATATNFYTINTPVTEGDHPVTYSLAGTDAALFEIDPGSGAIQVKDATLMHNPSYQLMIDATDDQNLLSSSVDLNIVTGSGQDGADIAIGTTGDDLFVFAGDFGHDTIIDFDTGAGSDDAIMFRYISGVASYAEVLSKAVDDGVDTTIALDTNNSIVLQNVVVSDLHTDDFRFA